MITNQHSLASEALARFLRELRPIAGFDALAMKDQAQENINSMLATLSAGDAEKYWRDLHARALASKASAVEQAKLEG